MRSWRQQISRLWSRLKSSRFEIEARAHAPLLPILSRQLQETIGSIESSTGEVCSSFGEMASLARKAAGMGAALVEQDGAPTVNDAIEDCRVMLAQLSDRLEHSGTLYARAIDQMEAGARSVHRVFRTLKELDQASFGSQMVALNAKIEAVHLGELGSTFELVAEQISSQAVLSSELTASVVSTLTELTSTMDTATSELKQLAEEDKQEAGRSRETAGQTLLKLEQASARMHDTVSETCKASETLYAQISRAIVNMQFQDRVSQRLGHVIDSLNSMSRALASNDEHCTAPSGSAVETRKLEIAEELAATYTMTSERMAHARSADSVSTSDSDSGGDVELF